MGKPQGCLRHGFHAFVPADAETAGEPEPCFCDCHTCDDSPCDDCTDGDPGVCGTPEPEASDLDARWDAALGDVPPPEPEAPQCTCQSGTWDKFDSPKDCLVHGSAVAQPPRRPPYAVAYAIEGGAQYEIALPGDATVRAVDGALVITHDKPVLAMGQVRPMEGA